MPPYRLPLELEVHILELATPPLLLDRVHHRVKFLSQIALVHRSFTRWAQDKLHEQFNFTLRGRAGEPERLQERLKVGFGSPSSGTLSRLYLDTRIWHEDGKWQLDRFDDPLNLQCDSPGVPNPAKGAVGRDDKALSGPWSPYDILCPWLSTVKTVWLFTPDALPEAGPFPLCTGTAHLEIDDSAWPDEIWSELSLAAPASLSSLVRRSVKLRNPIPALPNLRVVVLIRSCIRLQRPELKTAWPNLDVFESIATEPALHPNDLAFFRPLARTARFYHTICPDPTAHGWFDVDEAPPATDSRLKRCTFTWLEASPTPSDSSPDPLVTLRSALETANKDIPCAFKCVRSKATEEETIERILEDLVV